jgi:hypothetical protein
MPEEEDLFGGEDESDESEFDFDSSVDEAEEEVEDFREDL